ncbi:hypothetical protein [Desulfopila aestuarii]|uniref:Uncharacterized protein n=1 Tax=Desulfopila aestuarii DSM 18488 TaxID=1121416 RepID=A0A1M7YFM0_9BACT|nr:hypothetical protein [Desulfopila aestuarii]SHO51447.1 hypothetical protein SAMN02745220_04013 [Desulfopila aestuarii DSM 18488]
MAMLANRVPKDGGCFVTIISGLMIAFFYDLIKDDGVIFCQSKGLVNGSGKLDACCVEFDVSELTGINREMRAVVKK